MLNLNILKKEDLLKKYFPIFFTIVCTLMFFGQFFINLAYFLIFFLSIFFLNFKKLKLEIFDFLLVIFFFYICLSFIKHNNLTYLSSSILFIKFIFIFILFKQFENYLDQGHIIKSYFVILIPTIFLILDALLQRFTGYDVFKNPITMNRLSGPYGEELILGFLILYLCSVSTIFLYYICSKNFLLKVISLILISLLIISIFISGERINFLTALTLFLLYSIISKKFDITFCVLISLSVCIYLAPKIDLADRYNVLFEKISFKKKNINSEDFKKKLFKNDLKKSSKYIKSENEIYFFNTVHGAHILTAYEIWKKNKYFGSGIKSFRDKCLNQKIKSLRSEWRCSTHPHNLHLEILSETGLIGYILFFTFFLFFIFKIFLLLIKKRKYLNTLEYNLLLFLTILVLITFFPFKSSGRFFSSFFGGIVWFNMFCCNMYYIKLKRINYKT